MNDALDLRKKIPGNKKIVGIIMCLTNDDLKDPSEKTRPFFSDYLLFVHWRLSSVGTVTGNSYHNDILYPLLFYKKKLLRSKLV